MNILILTSIYPQKDDEANIGVTPVVQYFAKEWVKLGHNVIVIHNSSRYIRLLYLLPSPLLKKINSKLGIVISNKEQGLDLYTKSEGVICYRIPMLKLIPRTKYSELQINKQFKKILSVLEKETFVPDLILGHWENPQIPLLSMLKSKFNVKTALTFHEIVYIKQNRYKEWANRYTGGIDVIGARSKAISSKVKELLDLKREPFICYSGIPDKYFNEDKYKIIDFREKTKNSYLYVGRLIERKNVNISIRALGKVYGNDEFVFNIVGQGAEIDYLVSLVNDQELETRVNFIGYKNRDEVLDIMKDTEVFIMISNNETFGLVYIEAMSRGCLVIASKKGGMDGIIIDGYNGFLCEQGNELELISLCEKIREMPLEDKTKISQNAKKTAFEFKDSKISRKYLDNIINK